MTFTTEAKVKVAAGYRDTDTVPDPARLTECTAGANSWAATLPQAPDDPDDPAAEHFRLGVTTLAARWYKRRTSPEGVSSLGDGLALYVPGRDPDVDQMLGLGRWQKPRTG